MPMLTRSERKKQEQGGSSAAQTPADRHRPPTSSRQPRQQAANAAATQPSTTTSRRPRLPTAAKMSSNASASVKSKRAKAATSVKHTMDDAQAASSSSASCAASKVVERQVASAPAAAEEPATIARAKPATRGSQTRSRSRQQQVADSQVQLDVDMQNVLAMLKTREEQDLPTICFEVLDTAADGLKEMNDFIIDRQMAGDKLGHDMADDANNFARRASRVILPRTPGRTKQGSKRRLPLTPGGAMSPNEGGVRKIGKLGSAARPSTSARNDCAAETPQTAYRPAICFAGGTSDAVVDEGNDRLQQTVTSSAAVAEGSAQKRSPKEVTRARHSLRRSVFSPRTGTSTPLPFGGNGKSPSAEVTRVRAPPGRRSTLGHTGRRPKLSSTVNMPSRPVGEAPTKTVFVHTDAVPPPEESNGISTTASGSNNDWIDVVDNSPPTAVRIPTISRIVNSSRAAAESGKIHSPLRDGTCPPQKIVRPKLAKYRDRQVLLGKYGTSTSVSGAKFHKDARSTDKASSKYRPLPALGPTLSGRQKATVAATTSHFPDGTTGPRIYKATSVIAVAGSSKTTADQSMATSSTSKVYSQEEESRQRGIEAEQRKQQLLQAKVEERRRAREEKERRKRENKAIQEQAALHIEAGAGDFTHSASAAAQFRKPTQKLHTVPTSAAGSWKTPSFTAKHNATTTRVAHLAQPTTSSAKTDGSGSSANGSGETKTAKRPPGIMGLIRQGMVGIGIGEATPVPGHSLQDTDESHAVARLPDSNTSILSGVSAPHGISANVPGPKHSVDDVTPMPAPRKRTTANNTIRTATKQNGLGDINAGVANLSIRSTAAATPMLIAKSAQPITQAKPEHVDDEEDNIEIVEAGTVKKGVSSVIDSATVGKKASSVTGNQATVTPSGVLAAPYAQIPSPPLPDSPVFASSCNTTSPIGKVGAYQAGFVGFPGNAAHLGPLNETFDMENSVNASDYGLDGLDSDAETDNEDEPKKKVPHWATGDELKIAMRRQQSQVWCPPGEMFDGALAIPVRLRNVFTTGRDYRDDARQSMAYWEGRDVDLQVPAVSRHMAPSKE